MEIQDSTVVIDGTQEVRAHTLGLFARIDACLMYPRLTGRVEVGPEHRGDSLAAGHVKHGCAGHGLGHVAVQFGGEVATNVLPSGLAVLGVLPIKQHEGSVAVKHQARAGQGSQFPGPKPGEDRDFIKQPPRLAVQSHTDRPTLGLGLQATPFLDTQHAPGTLACG